jgi:hypothetical protein
MTELCVDICVPEDENLVHRKAESAPTPCGRLVPFVVLVHRVVVDMGEEGMRIVALAAAAAGMQRKKPCVAEVQDKPEADIVDVVDNYIEVVLVQILLPTPFWFVHFAFGQTYTDRNRG